MSDQMEPLGEHVGDELQRLRETSDLNFKHIDWGVDPNVLVGKNPEELAELIPVLTAQIQRIYQAQRQIALRLGSLVHKEGDISLSEEVDMIHNPDKYRIDYEPPDHEDSSQES